MKQIYFLSALVLLLALNSCQEQKTKTEHSYTIKGSVPKETKGKIYLLEFKNREYTPVDSVDIHNGNFKFEGKTSQPLLYSLRLNNKGKRANFFLENTNVTMHLNQDWTIESIKGSENTQLFKTYDDINEKRALNLDSILKTDNNSPVIAYFLGRNAYMYDYPELVSLRKQISPELFKNTYIEELDKAISKLEKLQPGQPAPDIIMENPDGKTFKLTDLKGKNILIDFWATWCPDCLKEIPSLKEIYKTYQQKNFTILSISLDRNKNSWKKAIADGLSWEHGFVENAWKSDAAQTYTLRWLPTYILIDTNGIIIARTINSHKMIEEIEKLVN
ncbi:thiol:disulfide interchange protein [Capnocytophaga stomatis]|uniref:TlpA disulfide reductase family protein n=1 Tax=Capnocytophaga stomatis TaxID=1848904 RepID=UPI00194DD9A5|nr:TlpA disulfide reductase family protein [Capnocytophaga stomatis]GIJ95423.1 thiol:disulfide interchange protein [Capnocytophaga stomatis]